MPALQRRQHLAHAFDGVKSLKFLACAEQPKTIGALSQILCTFWELTAGQMGHMRSHEVKRFAQSKRFAQVKYRA